MKNLVVIIFSIFSVSLFSNDNKDCKYINSDFNTSNLKEAKFKTISWNADSSELRSVTKDDDFLFLRKWACKTKGGLARLLIMTNGSFKKDDITLCQNKVLYIGKILLNDADYGVLEKTINNQKNNFEKFGTDMVLNLKSPKYQKFVVVISPLDNMIAVSLMYYQD